VREEKVLQPIEIGINLYEVDEETCAVEYMKLSGSMHKYQEKLKDIKGTLKGIFKGQDTTKKETKVEKTTEESNGLEKVEIEA